MADGNIAAMREALEYVKERIDNWWEYLEVSEKVESALAAPPRNCDVGNVKEQMERFEAYCNAHEPCESCPLDRPRVCPSCGVDWAQMPYEEEK